jgi:hypothetical protein
MDPDRQNDTLADPTVTRPWSPATLDEASGVAGRTSRCEDLR